MASFLTLNTNGLWDPKKRAGLLQWLSHLSLDFVCLQETHVLSSEECRSWFSSFGYQCLASPGSVHSCGSVILYRPRYALTKSQIDADGRFVMAEFKFHETPFRIVCLYAPNRNPDRDNFFESCESSIDPSIPTLLCGDFNAVFDRSVDRRGSNIFDTSRESCATLSSLFRECCVADVWRILHPHQAGFTWSKSDGSISSRIDLIGCPYSWLHFARSCDLLPCPFSDHSAVLFQCPIPEPLSRGPGRWKLNCAILSDETFVSAIRDFWASWRLRKNSFDSLQSWWDRGKEKIKGVAIDFYSRKSSESKQSRSLLFNLVTHLKSKIDLGRVSLLDIYESVQAKVADIDLAAAKGAQVRSRVRWAEECETSSRYFFRLEKKNGSENWISAMKNPDGSFASSIVDICDSWVVFYSKLFTACDTDLPIQDELLGKLPSSLSHDQASTCDGHITVGEAFSALSGMAKSKSPGSDGLTAEFYLAFWDVLGSDLVEVFNASLDSGLLPLSQREALITLIFKKGDRLEHKNWRPISLLNADYKLCARVLAGRLLKVIHNVVHPDQTCGVPGHFIGENVALLRDVAQFASETGTPLAILSLDQEKAFDRVDCHFLLAVLRRMGFGPSFIDWVKLLYTDIRSAILVNGYTSDWFFPSRDVRQGCPLSPLLYVLSIEVLAANLRAHPDIVGLSLPGIPSPLPVLSLYADDTSVIVTSDRATSAVFDVYADFEAGTGAKLNLGKCEGLWLGAWRNHLDSPVSISWNSVKIKTLGVFIGFGNLDEANWRPRLDAVKRCLNSWRSRSLSLSGKALIVNALALSRIWYVASLVFMPSWVCMELNKLVFSFFWSVKRDLVSRNVLFQSPDLGGFSVASTQYKVYSLLTQWVKRLPVSPNGWTFLLKYWFRDRFDATPFEVFASDHDFPSSHLPVFYSSLLQAWSALRGSSASSNLVIGSGFPGGPFPIVSATCKSCYHLLLQLNPVQPHYILKFARSFGRLDWPATWKSLQFMPLDRQVRDLNWKIAHGVLYTADRLISFGYQYPAACFCGYHLESPEHLFFSCPLVQSGFDWIQSMLFVASPTAPSITVRHVLFGFSSDHLLCVPRVFAYMLNVCKFLVWVQRNDYRFRSKPPSAICLLTGLKQRLRFYLPLYFKRFKSNRRRRYFLRQWGANGVLGSIRESSFVPCF